MFRLLVLSLTAVIGCALGAAAGESSRYREGYALVTFHSGVTRSVAQTLVTNFAAAFVREFPELSRQQARLSGVVRSDSRSSAELIAALRASPQVLRVEPDFQRRTADLRPPDDPRFESLWGLRNTGQSVNGSAGLAQADIQFLKAWGLARPATNTVVAVIDTGVEVGHPDLVANVWTNAAEIPGNGLDEDGNGYADDASGFDFVWALPSPGDSGYHGTHVAGTVAATGQNQLGVVGVAFRSQVMALKASDDGQSLPDSAIIAAIDYCTSMKQRGTNIVAINASFGGPDNSDLMRESIELAGAAGILFCAAAGNSGTDNDLSPSYPASYRTTNMIVVAASGQTDALAGFSCFGATTVDLAAPGVNILSTTPTNQASSIASVSWTNGTYAAGSFEFSGLTDAAGITGVVHYCGLGYPEDFPAEVQDNIALIQRGTLTFSDKVANATAAGARAVIIYNHVAGSINGTLQFPNGWLPTVWINLENGQELATAAPTLATVINAPDANQVYRYLNGTSMATPHVAGAVAFAAMNFPDESLADRRARVVQNTTPVPALTGMVISGGRLNLARIVDTDQNELPDWWEQQYFNQLLGTNAIADADADGAGNLAEWLAGTDPTDAGSVLRLHATHTAAGPVLSWPSREGRFYRLTATTQLSGGFTELLRTNIAATPPLNVATNLMLADEAARYFRLEIEP
jgi:subtilisin family serine protease